MKKVYTLLLLAAFVGIGTIGFAQEKTTKEIVKERKAVAKLAKSELKERATKDARNEAKRLKKEGWKVQAGSLPMEKALDRSYEMYFEYYDDGSPLYIMGDGQAKGGSHAAAKKSAQMLALTNLAEQIEIYVTELIEQTVANQEITQDQSVSLNKVVASSKSLVSQRLKNVTTVLDIYREEKGGRVESKVRIAYNKRAAMAVAKEVIREQLEKEGEDLHNELDRMWQGQ